MVELTDFCSKDEWRHNLLGPFEHGEYTYYSDGRLSIRTPGANGTYEKLPTIGKFIEKRFDKAIKEPVMVPLPDLPFYQKVTCRRCEGTGKQTPQHCETCDCECFICSGTGLVSNTDSDALFKIGAVCVPCVYVHQIAQLNNVLLNSITKPRQHVYFTFDGGDGILPTMPSKGIIQELVIA